MTLVDILEQLKYGELAKTTYQDIYNHRPLLISNINLGLTELYKRFPLKLKDVTIQQYSEIGTYLLLNRFTLTSGTEDKLYIMDSTSSPFEETELLMIDQVFTEEREEIPLNDDNSVYSVFTPSYNSIQIPYTEEENAISVVYRAKPKKLLANAADSAEVEIPTYLEEALLAYVAGRIMLSTNSEYKDFPSYYAKFEGICNNVSLYGLVHRDSLSNLRVCENGWV